MRVTIWLVGVILLAVQGCSVYMAAAGSREPNLAAFGVGSHRGQVEQQLGRPKTSSTSPEGVRSDTYAYTLGNEPSAGRAVAHGVADVLTLGIWEIFGTPIEAASQGDEKTITVDYDTSDRVQAIR